MPDVFEFNTPDEAAEHVASKTPRVDLESLRSRVEEHGFLVDLKSVGSRQLGCDIYCVDSAFPPKPVNLVGYSVSVVAVAAVYWCNASSRVNKWLLVETLNDLDQDYVVAFARLQERRLALSLDSRILILDGELLPRQGRTILWSEVRQSSLKLLEKLTSSGGVVAGVLKRSFSKRLASRLGVGVTDKVLASLILKPGEAIVLPHSTRMVKTGECIEAFYKPLRGLSPAVKVEACCSTMGECLALLSMLAREAGPSGFPWALDIVDSLVKNSVGVIDSIARLLLSRLARSEYAEIAFSSNPQERL